MSIWKRLPHLGGFFWVALWLFPLAGAVSTIGDTARPAWAAVGLLAAFCLAYAVVTWAAFDGFIGFRGQIVGFLTVAALGAPLPLAFGDAWLTVTIYVVATASAVFGGGPRPPLAIPVAGAALVLFIAEGIAVGSSAAPLVGIAVGAGVFRAPGSVGG